MNKKHAYNRIWKSDTAWLIIGCMVSLICCLPYLILGEDSIVTYHDQLDGELMTYILNAKYLFSGVKYYQELMNGIPREGVLSPAPAFVLLYKIFKPYAAYVMSLIIVKIVSFCSMYLLVSRVTGKKHVAFLCGTGFMLLPFYAVYGLCIPGEPLLMLALIDIWGNKSDTTIIDGKKPTVKSCIVMWITIAIYAACSSLALVGYVWVFIFFVFAVMSLIRKKNRVAGITSFVVITAVYVIENMSLVTNMLGITEGYVSHKSEVVRNSADFLTGFWNNMVFGADYTEGKQQYYLPLIILAGIIFAVQKGVTRKAAKAVNDEKQENSDHLNDFRMNRDISIQGRYLITGIAVNFVIAVLASIYSSKPVVDIINSLSGTLHDFNLGRIVWVMPAVWVCLLGISVSLLYDICRLHAKKVLRIIAAAVSTVAVILMCFNAFLSSDLKSNVVKLIKGDDYYMMTWRQFFAEDLFEEVDKVIGLPKDEYRVVSLGIYPAAAAYNGFYCLDAYSNNYDVEYKHEFRKVIAPQLEKNIYLRQWFDDWGNRCYIVINEVSNYFTLEKKWTPYTYDNELDFDQLRSMGCHYLISASYLLDSEELGLKLLNEEPIQTEGSWYRLWVYEF